MERRFARRRGRSRELSICRAAPHIEAGTSKRDDMIKLYGAAGSGSVAVEAALTLLGEPFEVLEAATWEQPEARERVAAANPMRQVPALVLPDGEVMTESAAILIDLADRHPEARLAPPIGDPRRRQFLRWMVYVSSAIYSLHWIKPDVSRIGAPASAAPDVVDAIHDRIAFCWSVMNEDLDPAPYLLGRELTVLDLYVAVISRFGPWRKRFYEVAPRLAPAIRLVDADPRLADLWSRRFADRPGWD